MRIFRDISNQNIDKTGPRIGISVPGSQLLSGSNDQENLFEGPIDILCVSHLK